MMIRWLRVIGSAIFLLLCFAMGATFFWDLGGLATRMDERLQAMPGYGALYRRLPMPSWAFRAFGIWCVVFGIGQFIYVAAN